MLSPEAICNIWAHAATGAMSGSQILSQAGSVLMSKAHITTKGLGSVLRSDWHLSWLCTLSVVGESALHLIDPCPFWGSMSELALVALVWESWPQEVTTGELPTATTTAISNRWVSWLQGQENRGVGCAPHLP